MYRIIFEIRKIPLNFYWLVKYAQIESSIFAENKHLHIIHARKQKFLSKLNLYNFIIYFGNPTDRKHDPQSYKWVCI